MQKKRKPAKKKAKKKPKGKRKRRVRKTGDDSGRGLTSSEFKHKLDQRDIDQLTEGRVVHGSQHPKSAPAPRPPAKELYDGEKVGTSLYESVMLNWFGRPVAVRKVTRKDGKVEWYADARVEDLSKLKQRFEAVKGKSPKARKLMKELARAKKEAKKKPPAKKKKAPVKKKPAKKKKR